MTVRTQRQQANRAEEPIRMVTPERHLRGGSNA
jgi:hypothetical protein